MVEFSNPLSDHKQDIINDVPTQPNNMQERRKKEEAGTMLAKYCPHFKEMKRNYECNIVASLEPQSMPT